MKVLASLFLNSLTSIRLALVKADLIPQLINTLNPQCLSFSEAVGIHVNIITIITNSLLLATRAGLATLQCEDDDEEQTVYETILRQVLVPSEQYICHLCKNRFSIVDGEQSMCFLDLLVQHLKLSSSYQPAMDFVLHMPVFLSIPSCFAFFENDNSIWSFLICMNNDQREWHETMGEVRQMWPTMHRMLRMEGIEDAIEEKLRNDQRTSFGGDIVVDSMEWNNQLGMNLPRRG
ncbi:hypothetical protein BLNAU_11741 [Blattamonas nauphoetae]|uniref:Uncharacterized protein n=1 Tax=Blattamonas nauphoetae TaxID=2049346 RepID=A0ABQ9XLI1_9EUKA|nr:hypothetical protein BLNAU_11741 [Blattamonas nauphoetae]